MTGNQLVPLINWSLALAFDGTLLAAVAMGLVAAGRVRQAESIDRLWKGVLLAGILTATLQSVYDLSPLTLPVVQQTTGVEYTVKRTVILGGIHPSVSTIRHITQPAGPPWPAFVLLVWVSVAAFRFSRSSHAHCRFVSSLGERQGVTDHGLLQVVASLSGIAGLGAPPALTHSESIGVPIVLSAREICLPQGITEVMEPAELRMLLAHEIAHIGRGDGRRRRVANVVCCALWFVPLLPLVERRRREAAEIACDDWAVVHAGDALGMARCLVRVAEWTAVRQHGTGPALIGTSPMGQRVERLLEGDAPATHRTWSVVLALALLPLLALTPRVAASEGQGSPPHTRMEQERVVLLSSLSAPRSEGPLTSLR